MTVRLKADGATGDVAIYTGTDDAPFTSPLSNISRLRFHSDLEYPRLVSKHTGSVVLTSVSADTFHRAKYTLFAHGYTGNPYCEGYVTIGAGGTKWPLIGSVPVQRCSGTNAFGGATGAAFARWVHLGSDATNVVLAEHVYVPDYAATLSSITLNYTIWLTDWLAEGTTIYADGTDNETLRIEPTRCKFSGGKFDSNYQYIRAGASSSSFQMTSGRTIELTDWDYYWLSGGKARVFAWKHDNGITQTEWVPPQETSARDTAVAQSGFSATSQEVTTE